MALSVLKLIRVKEMDAKIVGISRKKFNKELRCESKYPNKVHPDGFQIIETTSQSIIVSISSLFLLTFSKLDNALTCQVHEFHM